jgi:hypothetical protein
MTAEVQPAYRFLVTLDPTDAFIPRELIRLEVEKAEVELHCGIWVCV